MRHLAVRRVTGARAGAPPPYEEPGPVEESVGEAEYAAANTRSQEEG